MIEFRENRVSMEETSKDRLKEFRHILNITQLQVAEVLGISDKTYSTYENSSRTTQIPLYLLKRLEEYYGLNKEWILNATPPMLVKSGNTINSKTNQKIGKNATGQNKNYLDSVVNENNRSHGKEKDNTDYYEEYLILKGRFIELEKDKEVLNRRLQECLRKIK